MNTWRSTFLVSFVLAAVGGCALSADPGERGLPGEPGADGTNGSPGGKGQDGDDGTDGKDGMPGTDGAAGVSPFMGPDPNDGSIYYNGGNVGIGTMTPGNPLEVHATAAGGPVAQFESPNVSSYLKIRATGFNGSDWLVGADTLGGTTAGFSVYDVTSNAYRMFIDGSGRVGIGTAIPEAPLHVAVLNDAPLLTLERTGQVSDGKWSLAPNATGLFFLDDTGVQAGAGPTRVFFANDGKVGIGTTTPDAGLDVKGGIKSTIGVTDGSNIAVARAHSSYMINVSSNGDVGLAVRSGIYHVLLSEDPAPTVAFVAPISVLNGQTATFSVVGGMLTISGLSPGNNKVSVFEN